MDLLSKRHRQVIENQERDNYDLPPNQFTWAISHNGKRLQRWNRKTAQTIIHTNAARKYWTKKAKIPVYNDRIAWGAMGMAQRSIPFYKTVWLRRWLSHRLPQSYNLHRWNKQTFTNCPCCGEIEQDHDHFLTCKDERIQEKK